MSLGAEVVFRDEIQGFPGLFEVSVQGPEHIGEVHFPGRGVLGRQLIEPAAFFFIVLRADAFPSGKCRPGMPGQGIAVLALHVIGKQAQDKETYISDAFVKPQPVLILHHLAEAHEAFKVQIVESYSVPDPFLRPEGEGVALDPGEGGEHIRQVDQKRLTGQQFHHLLDIKDRNLHGAGCFQGILGLFQVIGRFSQKDLEEQGGRDLQEDLIVVQHPSEDPFIADEGTPEVRILPDDPLQPGLVGNLGRCGFHQEVKIAFRQPEALEIQKRHLPSPVSES